MGTQPVFDCDAMMAALDSQRADLALGWTALADVLWKQSADLNAQLGDHAMCPGALVRTVTRGAMSCQYALIILRWLGRPPEDFLTGPVVDVGETKLPDADPGSRLRWDLSKLYAALDEHRRDRQLTWTALAKELDCTPSRLTNLRTARLADMDLTMRVTQRVGQPAARFVQPAGW
jgi:hypothetical protein